MRGTIKGALPTGLGNDAGWADSSINHINLGYGGQQGLGPVAHHMNPNLTPGGNVNAGGLQNAREEQFRRTGQPLGTGWGEPSGEELKQILERMKQNKSSNLPTAMPQSGTAFPIGNQAGLNPNDQRVQQAMQYGRLNGSIPTFNQGGVAT